MVSCTNPHRPDADYPGTTMNIPSSAESSGVPKGGAIPLILGCIVLAIALTGSASIVTNYVFDLIGFR